MYNKGKVYIFNNKEPFIVQFSTLKGNHYIYDICSNLIINSNDIIYEIISSFKTKTKTELIRKILHKYQHVDEYLLNRQYDFISHLINNYSCFYPPDKITFNPFVSRRSFKTQVANNSMLVLEITEKCNFRCKYCSYSGKYYYLRKHSNKSMSYDVAKKSINYFYSTTHSNKRTVSNNDLAITFYGGEALLEFELVKKCIEYAKAVFYKSNFKIRFTVNTNGSMLKKRFVDYLFTNNVRLSISLDGPKETHDLNRVYRNGKGSFDAVWSNIKAIKNKYPEYYSNNISFLVTLHKNINLSKMHKFFNDKRFFSDSSLIRIGPVNMLDNSFVNELNAHPKWDVYVDSFYKKYDKYLICPQKNVLAPFVDSFCKEKYFAVGQLNCFRPLKNRNNFTTTCLPGTGKLFVTTEGDFFPCERVGNGFPIGDYKKGIDYNKSKQTWSLFIDQITKNCSKCLAINFCKICFANAEKDHCFESSYYCEKTREAAIGILKSTFSILEKNPDAFSRLEEIQSADVS